MQDIALFWFRRDLRWHDNSALLHALQSGMPVQPIFIFDKLILDELQDEDDARVTFLHQEVDRLKGLARQRHKDLHVYYGEPVPIIQQLCQDLPVKAIYTNRDYEPYARERDGQVAELCEQLGIAFHTFKDQVLFEKEEILTGSDKPYKVFTPYSRQWRSRLQEEGIPTYPSEDHLDQLLTTDEPQELISLEEMGFRPSSLSFPDRQVSMETINQYRHRRNFPAKEGTSRLSVHLRFGTVSIRQLVAKAHQGSDSKWLTELIWREFYMMILWNFPHVVDSAFKPNYDRIPWENTESHFEAWCQGKTGYPLVDAGMRQLNTEGYMHNRVRMVVASFLTKHLLIDWRWGEAYFARRLLDYELSSNNGGWQWAASSGTDAQPYFRIFNPHSQLEKFDPKGEYVRRYVTEFDSLDYPQPIVEHKAARERTLRVFKEALG